MKTKKESQKLKKQRQEKECRKLLTYILILQDKEN